jgi:hypothetical protein
MPNHAQTRGFYGSLVLGSVTARLRKARRYINGHFLPLAPHLRRRLVLAHPNGEREVAYDREFRLSPLSEALDKAHGLRHHRREHDAGLEGRVLIRTVAASIILQSVPQPTRERRPPGGECSTTRRRISANLLASPA